MYVLEIKQQHDTETELLLMESRILVSPPQQDTVVLVYLLSKWQRVPEWPFALRTSSPPVLVPHGFAIIQSSGETCATSKAPLPDRRATAG